MVKIGHLLSLFVRYHIKVDVVIAFVDFQVHICLENRSDRWELCRRLDNLCSCFSCLLRFVFAYLWPLFFLICIVLCFSHQLKKASSLSWYYQNKNKTKTKKPNYLIENVWLLVFFPKMQQLLPFPPPPFTFFLAQNTLILLWLQTFSSK